MKASFFKQFESSSLDESLSNLVKGGIGCDEITDLIGTMSQSEDDRVVEQGKVVTAMYAAGEIQCT